MNDTSNWENFVPVSEMKDIVVRELDGELLIYNLKTHKAFCLNQTSAFIWQNADGTKSVDEISDNLSKNYQEKVSSELVWLALNDLAKENLITNLPKENLPSINRREVIKRIGIGTAIALPIVTGLVAPNAVQASSICSPGEFVGNPCTTDAECDFFIPATGCLGLGGGSCKSGVCCCIVPE